MYANLDSSGSEQGSVVHPSKRNFSTFECHKMQEIPSRAERLLASQEIIYSLESMFLLRLDTINREMLFAINTQHDLQICESYLSTN